MEPPGARLGFLFYGYGLASAFSLPLLTWNGVRRLEESATPSRQAAQTGGMALGFVPDRSLDHRENGRRDAGGRDPVVLLGVLRRKFQERLFVFRPNFFGTAHTEIPTTQHFGHQKLLPIHWLAIVSRRFTTPLTSSGCGRKT